MKISEATSGEFDTVRQITETTINAIYPQYYPIDAVREFLNFHCDENIKRDINAGNTYLLSFEGAFAGTGTIQEGNHIARVFVLPEHQGKGLGSELMEFLEHAISEKYSYAVLDASWPAYSMYLKRGYQPVSYEKLPTENGAFLCYNVMEKSLPTHALD